MTARGGSRADYHRVSAAVASRTLCGLPVEGGERWVSEEDDLGACRACERLAR